MNTQIKFTFEGTDYVLEYSRETAQKTARKGLNLSNLDNDFIGTVELLWAGAFLKNHRRVVNDKALLDEIYAKFPRKDELLETLIKMYLEPSQALIEEPDEDDEGNIKWGTD